MKTYVISVQNGHLLGYCRAISQSQVSSYDEYDWIWDASVARGRGSVGFLYVDPEHRSQGLGAALAAKAGDILFEHGCKEVCGHTPIPALQEMCCRWGLEKVGGVVTMSRAGW